jgi:predicted AAA+ superfamily ATPase
MFIERTERIEKQLEAGKVLAIFGPRQSGKTSLIRKYLEQSRKKYRLYQGDDLSVQELFSVARMDRLNAGIGDIDLLVIDEAQVIPNIGAVLKLIVDAYPSLSIIISGSSSFELSQKIGEPLVGRYNDIHLYPLSFAEFRGSPLFDPILFPDVIMRYGGYPAVATAGSDEEKTDTLRKLVEGYLLKDILSFDRLKKPDVLVKLLTLLAHQIGSEVSVHELGVILGVPRTTVTHYLELLERSFVIFPLGAFSNNLRNEVVKKKKYYFYDLGIRNMLVKNFSELRGRADIGGLWENFLVLERKKLLAAQRFYGSTHFWRLTSGSEVDYVEYVNGASCGYEFSYSNTGKKRIPASWKESYPNASWENVHKENYLDFLAQEKNKKK